MKRLGKRNRVCVCARACAFVLPPAVVVILVLTRHGDYGSAAGLRHLGGTIPAVCLGGKVVLNGRTFLKHLETVWKEPPVGT